MISRKGTPNIKGLGRLRYAAERTFALLYQFKHLAVRGKHGTPNSTTPSSRWPAA
ncbi:hypothetical protein OG372_35090 [Streptomyces sp. NBC_01020]|uniref:hypothetical protein n=1 Tax=unclassified Streptomyces TaxID=2593676 RepID=UPI003255B4FC|nr:hypothetical protein OG372_35090 [Streptomyces sp. NBC_01020]WSX65459.1 hypothetical protein OG221_01955 [Streptomyces sp. NBC_00932]